jgi:hypothetical protein
MKNYSNAMNIAKLEETLNFLKQQGVTDVYVQIKDGNNVEFCDITNPAKTYAIAYSNLIYEMTNKATP